MLGLLALGIATIVRHTAAAITAFVTVVLILPLVLMAFPHSIQDRVGKFLPANIGTAVLTVRPGFHDFPTFAPWTGMAILGGYTLAALVMGAWVLLRRDA